MNLDEVLFPEVMQDVGNSHTESEKNTDLGFGVIEALYSSDSDDEDISRYLSTGRPRDVRSKSNSFSTTGSVCSDNAEFEDVEQGTVVIRVNELKRVASEAVAAASPRKKAYKRGECPSKSALCAKRNRDKKKKEFALLESQVEVLSKENALMKEQLQLKCKGMEKLQKEVHYLRNVIANQSSLSSILQCIQTIPNLDFQTNNIISDKSEHDLVEEKKSLPTLKSSQNENQPTIKYVRVAGKLKQIKTRSATVIQDSPTPSPEDKEISGGVCLHVSDKKASLEFCASCAESASENWKRSKDRDHCYVKGSE